MAYNNPTPVAVAVIRVRTAEGLRLLGMRRGTPPMRGGLTFPAGYVEQGESAESAAARETQEELGLDLCPTKFRPFLTMTTAENRILIFCIYEDILAEYAFEEFSPTTEALSVHPITKDCVLAFPTHDEVRKSKVWQG